MEIWDVPGASRYSRLQEMFLENVDAAFIVFDVTSYGSFVQSLQVLQKALSRPMRPLIILIGNKAEAYPEAWQVNVSAVKEMPCLEGCMFKLVSAESGMNVQELFDGVAESLVESHEDLLLYNVRQRETLHIEGEAVDERELPADVVQKLPRVVGKDYKNAQFHIISSLLTPYPRQRKFLIQVAVVRSDGVIVREEYEIVQKQ